MGTEDKWPLDVLLAEDTDTDAELFQMAIAQIGDVRSLHVVRDGEELIQYLLGEPPFNHKPPDIIFLDLKMPKLNGFDVLKWLKKHPQCSVIPTIMLSNSWFEQDIQRAYELGVNAFFSKPLIFNQLIHVLKVTFEFWSLTERPQVVELCRKR